jgi:hypothetical protein
MTTFCIAFYESYLSTNASYPQMFLEAGVFPLFRNLGYDPQGRPQYAYLHLEGPPQNVGGPAAGRTADGGRTDNQQAAAAPLFNSDNMPWTSLNENRKAFQHDTVQWL